MATAHQATPTAKEVVPREMTRPGPNRAMSGPATTKDISGTMSGPGAMASPARRADQPQTPCSHNTMDRSIAPKEAEETSATSDEPGNALDRNRGRARR